MSEAVNKITENETPVGEIPEENRYLRFRLEQVIKDRITLARADEVIKDCLEYISTNDKNGGPVDSTLILLLVGVIALTQPLKIQLDNSFRQSTGLDLMETVEGYLQAAKKEEAANA